MKNFTILGVAAIALSLSACSLTPKAPETINTGDALTGSTGMMDNTGAMDNNVMVDNNGNVMTGDEVMMSGEIAGDNTMSETKDIVENAMLSNDHTTLIAAVKAAELVDTLKSAGPFTIFAPTNEAFAKLPAGTVESLVKPENKAALAKILTYHVVAGKYLSSDLKDGMKLKTVQGEELTVTMKDGNIMVNGSNITTAGIVSSNGVIFVIDTVLMPKK